jgi:hypothetical protein
MGEGYQGLDTTLCPRDIIKDLIRHPEEGEPDVRDHGHSYDHGAPDP